MSFQQILAQNVYGAPSHMLTPAVIYKKYPEMRVQYVVGQNLLYKKLRWPHGIKGPYDWQETKA